MVARRRPALKCKLILVRDKILIIAFSVRLNYGWFSRTVLKTI